MDLPPNGGCGAAHSSAQGGLQGWCHGVLLLLVLPSERKAVQSQLGMGLHGGCRSESREICLISASQTSFWLHGVVECTL